MEIPTENSSSLYRKFGDRTSSLISLYPHFNSYRDQKLDGEIRYLTKGKVVAMANEPLASQTDRKNLILNFMSDKQFQNFDKLAFPISEQLAIELKNAGLHVWQIGVEPIFVLADYFKGTTDILNNFPIARNLKKRGACLIELSSVEIEKNAELIQELKEDWLSKKKLSPLEFLNVVDPLSLEEYKRYFALQDRGTMTALLTASPIYLNHQIIGYFFNDILKKTDARSATSELLMIEAMRLLHTEGILEVRLGMCPLAMINQDEKDASKINKIYEKWKWGYNFKSLFQFKNKLHPTKWRPLYLASNQPSFNRMIKYVMKVHLSTGFFKDFLVRNWYATKRSLELKDHLKNKKIPKDKNLSLMGFISRIKITTLLFTFFIGLHLLKNAQPKIQAIYDLSAYIPSQITALGLFIGPLFHNHTMHLLGDQLSFLVFAGAIEFTFGQSLMLLITSLGLWLSNPLTHFLLSITLKLSSPYWWEKVLMEKDYGSSNAVFALVGASIFMLKRNAWLLMPFIFHATYICLQRESFLAFHHFAGIYLGYAGARWYFALKYENQKI